MVRRAVAVLVAAAATFSTWRGWPPPFAWPGGEAAAGDPELLESLRALGYVQ